jgi:catechol 2,3-dioxygenase
MTPDSFHAPDVLRIGTVMLNVRDLERMIGFYNGFLGLEILKSENENVVLGFEPEQPLVILEYQVNAVPRPSNAAGLYHFAILTSSREKLAHALLRLVQSGYPLQGAADHFVSEAIYLADPEGNGIEIYADRPRETWEWDGDQIRIGTIPLDVDSLLALAQDLGDTAQVLSKGTVMGHLHLQVTEIMEAMAFYEDTLGFEPMGRYGTSAAFYSAGGYHHHIGLNTWASAGGPKAETGMLGLMGYELIYPGEGAIEKLVQSLSSLEFDFTRNDDSIKLIDPSGNPIIIRKESEISEQA